MYSRRDDLLLAHDAPGTLGLKDLVERRRFVRREVILN